MVEPALKKQAEPTGSAAPKRKLRTALDFLVGTDVEEQPDPEAAELPGAFAFMRHHWKATAKSPGGEKAGLWARYRQLNRQYQQAKERHAQNFRVYEAIAQSARLSKEFVALLVASCIIASFGLFADSAATVIGAMLVAPLMMPILGFALASIWGDTRLLYRSAATLGIGVGAAVLVGLVLGLLVPGVELTGQIAARGNPSLYDLMVGIFSGLIGAYAYVNPRISSSIAGVAIAVALVPPLCSSGVALALGEGTLAMGAFLLFLSNLIGISLAASFVFWRLKVHPALASEQDVNTRAKRNVTLSTVFLVLIAIPLAYFMARTIETRRQHATVQEVLHGDLPQAEIFSLSIDRTDERARVEAMLLLPAEPDAGRLAEVRDRIASVFEDEAEVQLVVLRAYHPAPTPEEGGAATAEAKDSEGVDGATEAIAQPPASGSGAGAQAGKRRRASAR